MRVKIEEGAEPGSVVCDLLECFPEAEEYADALAALERTGVYQGGGGAAPVFQLVRVD